MITATAFCDDAGHFSVDNSEVFLEAIRGEFLGKPCVVTVSRKQTKRSLAQNRWHWGVAIPLIAEHCGYDHHEHEALHYDLLAVRFGTKAVTPLIPEAPPRIVPSKTSSELNTIEFSDYMDWLIRYAAEKFDVVIPFPNEVL